MTGKTKETNARGTDTGSRSATKEIKSSRIVSLTHGKQYCVCGAKTEHVNFEFLI